MAAIAAKRILVTIIGSVLLIGLVSCAAPAAQQSAAPAAQRPAQPAPPAPEQSATPAANAGQAAAPTKAPQEEAASAAAEPTQAPAATEAPKATEAPAAAEVTTAAQPQAPAANNEAERTVLPTTTAGSAAGSAAQPAATAVEEKPIPALSPEPTQAPAPLPTPTPSTGAGQAETPAAAVGVATATPAALEDQLATQAVQEARVVELEWPPQMRLGESDIVRLALIPSQEGYTLTTEFQGNQTVTKTVSVKRPAGFELNALGRLDGVGFDIAPQAEQQSKLPEGETVMWRWTISPRRAGQQRLSVLVKLLWTPLAGSSQAPRESQVYSKGLSVQVDAILGMTTAQASSVGMVGLVLGSGLSVIALAMRRNKRVSAADAMQVAKPNASLVIEPQPGIHLAEDELQLLRTLFRRYARVSVEREFRSGYSGARTFLCLPILADGRADAYTIAKMGERRGIQREFENYETYVKDTLPPMTARIQEPPVTLSPIGISSQAVLRYTFIGEQGRMPVSLRESLLADPNPALLRKLFNTFGPNWWMQRRPYSFRLSQEYDRLLPSHYVVEPIEAGAHGAKTLNGNVPPSEVELKIGDVVMLRDFPLMEPRADGMSYSLTGDASPGKPPLRLRVKSSIEPRKPRNVSYRVIGTRETLLRDYVAGLDLLGLPDPLDKLAATEHRNISGTQSPIHGDLNLENVLVGPGNFVWLIDFAHTRDGHPLFDFAHLEAEVVAQVIAPQMPSPQDYLNLLRGLEGATEAPDTHTFASLLFSVHDMAWHCLFNAMQKREYWMALYMACLGALKFNNLNAHQRHLLYLTAAYIARTF